MSHTPNLDQRNEHETGVGLGIRDQDLGTATHSPSYLHPLLPYFSIYTICIICTHDMGSHVHTVPRLA